jgi:hypothetical protein
MNWYLTSIPIIAMAYNAIALTKKTFGILLTKLGFRTTNGDGTYYREYEYLSLGLSNPNGVVYFLLNHVFQGLTTFEFVLDVCLKFCKYNFIDFLF